MPSRTVDHAHTVDAYQRRLDKAGLLVDALRNAGFTHRSVSLFDQGQRRVAEKFAGVRQGSDETWTVVLAVLRGSRVR